MKSIGNNTTKKIYAIHGAFSTPRMFSYLKDELSEYSWTFLKYKMTEQSIEPLIDQAMVEIEYPCHVVGHSMGGLIALSLAGHPCVESITTIATPYGGIDLSLIQSYLTRSHFLSEIASNSKFIKQLHSLSVTKPTLRIISTDGFNPFMWEPNDGVVTVRSQLHSATGIYKEIEANHSEVMMHPETVRLLKDWWT